MFSLDRPLQLLGVGLCGTEGGLTVELELYEVDPEDFRWGHMCIKRSPTQCTRAHARSMVGTCTGWTRRTSGGGVCTHCLGP